MIFYLNFLDRLAKYCNKAYIVNNRWHSNNLMLFLLLANKTFCKFTLSFKIVLNKPHLTSNRAQFLSQCQDLPKVT